jgi:protein-disulfide isomerase
VSLVTHPVEADWRGDLRRITDPAVRDVGHASPVQRNRILLAGGALGVAAVIVVVLVVIVGSNGGSSTTTTVATTGGSPRTTVPKAAAALTGVPQHGDTLGDPKAAVTLTVFEDPQCPFCRQWNVDTLPTVVQRYVKPGVLKLVYRGVEIIGPNSEPGLRAVYAAAAQNKLWTLVEQLYLRQGAENSGWITPALIRAAATAGGADGRAILASSSSPGVQRSLKQAETDATAIDLQGTPTFVIERPPSLPKQLSVPGLDPASFMPVLDAALQ